MDAKKRSLVVKIGVPSLLVVMASALWAIKAFSAPHPEAGLLFPFDFTERSQIEEALASGLPVILDFSADWCAPCRELEPVLRALHAELSGRAVIAVVNVDDEADIASDYPVSVVPTQFLFDSSGRPFSPSESLAMELKAYSLKTTGEHVLTAHEGGLSRQQLVDLLSAMGMDQ